MEPRLVEDLMSENPFTLNQGSTLAEAWDMMETSHVRHVPILDQDGALVGLLTERDVLRAVGPALENLPLQARNELLADTPVEDVMVHDPETVMPDDDLVSAAQTLLDNKYGCLPVVGREMGLTGILTESDFVRYFASR
ncbi:MAG: CBS domain-containing protein [Myxococcota bacterium]